MTRSFSYSFLPVLLLIAATFSGCTEEGKKGDGAGYMPAHTGADGEVLVVCNDAYWNGSLGDTIKGTLGQPMELLPQPEPLYHVGQVTHQELTGILQKHRNLILVDISKENEKKGELTMQKNVWSKGQLVVRLKGSDPQKVKEAFIENRKAILQKIHEFEMDRKTASLRSKKDKSVARALRKKHDLTLLVPKGSEIKKNNEDVVWIERHRMKHVGSSAHDVIQGLVIYTYPYTDTNAFDRSRILKVRDSVLKEHIPGPSEGSYMTTETRFKGFDPKIEEMDHNGQYAIEMRGLWRVENDHMGGPFSSLTTYDKERNRIVTVDGYVFAPKFDKREYLREVEGMILSLSFE